VLAGHKEKETMGILIVLRGTVGAGKTTVAEELMDTNDNMRIMEVDDIKIRKYGSTMECNPEEDFREAGIQAKKLLDQGHDVVVIEPFCEALHYQYFLASAQLPEDSEYVIPIWLDCDLANSLSRKKQEIPEQMIRLLHQWYPKRYIPEDELHINTDNISKEEVVATIKTHLAKRCS
jgi:adenylylsulfate kinase-like enzyme